MVVSLKSPTHHTASVYVVTVCAFVHMYVCMYVCIPCTCACAHACVRTYIHCTSVCVCMLVTVLVFACVCVYVCTRNSTCMYTFCAFMLVCTVNQKIFMIKHVHVIFFMLNVFVHEQVI